MKKKIYGCILFLLSVSVSILNGSENDDVRKLFVKLRGKNITKMQNLVKHLGSRMDHNIQRLQEDAEGNILPNKLYWKKFNKEIQKTEFKETIWKILGQNFSLFALRTLIVDKKYEEDGKTIYSIFRTLLVKTKYNGNFIITRETIAGMDPWKNYGSPIISCHPVQRDEEDYVLWKNVSGKYQMWINMGLDKYYHIVTAPEMNYYIFKKSATPSDVLKEKIAYITMMWSDEFELSPKLPHLPNQIIISPNLLHIMTFKQMNEIISEKSKKYTSKGSVLQRKELDLQNEKMKKDDKNRMSDYDQVKASEYYWENMRKKIKEIFVNKN